MIKQEKREKIIEGLEDFIRCYQDAFNDGGEGPLVDALDLLKEQQPHVMTLEEVEAALDTVVWVDDKRDENTGTAYALIESYSSKYGYVEFWHIGGDFHRAKYVDYGKTWRCWSSRPTDKQMTEAKWDD